MLKSTLLNIGMVILIAGCGQGEYRIQERTTYADYEDLSRDNPPVKKPDSLDATIDAEMETGDEIVPEDPLESALELRGGIQDVTAKGDVYGWAVFLEDLSLVLNVDVYLNGGVEVGDFIGSIPANQEGFDGGFDGNHAFRLTVPEEYRNGETQSISFYADIDGRMESVLPDEFTFRAFTPTTEGQAYYNSTLRPLLQNGCGGCHGNRAPAVNYNSHYEYILSPNPAKIGSATNNVLINKASGGMNHGGNNRCGANGKNGSPCTEIQRWWQLEFG